MTTDNKTLAVDVLNEMERASSRLFDAGLHGDLSLDEARAAVAELIDEIGGAIDAISDGDAQSALRGLNNALARVKGESA
ncbi:hypothetical protein [Stenotrophomonas indicatrix]|uniref:hypothetical protein n=1 Tax=Stenotrophomonas indicatrix TaxID=2045451 RepID=UPI0008B56DFC|nr:hypothetical protein [Stenotrophomonas indicatrix]SEU13085.1 hypothetical protein SAMN05720615_11857 [Stenotrophomonas indicatrix]